MMCGGWVLWEGRPVHLRLLQNGRQCPIRARFRFAIGMRSAVPWELSVWDPVAVSSYRRRLRLDLALLVVGRGPVGEVAPHLDVVRRELANLRGQVVSRKVNDAFQRRKLTSVSSMPSISSSGVARRWRVGIMLIVRAMKAVMTKLYAEHATIYAIWI